MAKLETVVKNITFSAARVSTDAGSVGPGAEGSSVNLLTVLNVAEWPYTFTPIATVRPSTLSPPSRGEVHGASR